MLHTLTLATIEIRSIMSERATNHAYCMLLNYSMKNWSFVTGEFREHVSMRLKFIFCDFEDIFWQQIEIWVFRERQGKEVKYFCV